MNKKQISGLIANSSNKYIFVNLYLSAIYTKVLVEINSQVRQQGPDWALLISRDKMIFMPDRRAFANENEKNCSLNPFKIVIIRV